MFILKATTANPSPDLSTLTTRIRAFCPEGIRIEQALATDDDEFVDMVREELEERDPETLEAFRKCYEGDISNASNEVLIRFGLAHRGRGLLHILYTAEDVGGEGALGDGKWIDDLLGLAANERLRVFDELAGSECELPA